MLKVTPFIKQLHISFDPAAEIDVVGYLIHATQNPADFNPNPEPLGATLINRGPETSFTYPGIATGIWYVKVAAYDSFGEDSLIWSNTVPVTVTGSDGLDTIPPPAPAWNNFTEQDTGFEGEGVFATCFVKIGWTCNKPADFSNYALEQRMSGQSWGEAFPVYSDYYKLSPCVAGAGYEFRLSAIDKWGNASNPSSTTNSSAGMPAGILAVTAKADTVPPAVPFGITARPGMSTIFIYWNPNSEPDLKHYIVEVSESNSFPVGATTSTFITSGPSYNFSGTIGTTYYIRVSAKDYSGNTSAPCAWIESTPGTVPVTNIDGFGLEASKLFKTIPVMANEDVFMGNNTGASVESINHGSIPAHGVAWIANTVYYNGVAYSIPAGATTELYVVVDFTAPSPVFAGSATQLTYTGQFTMAKNNAGTIEVVWHAEANAVIGSAYIMNAAITNAKISDLSADKINAGTLDVTNRITANSIVLEKFSTGSGPNLMTNGRDTFDQIAVGTRVTHLNSVVAGELVGNFGFSGYKSLYVVGGALGDTYVYLDTPIQVIPSKWYILSFYVYCKAAATIQCYASYSNTPDFTHDVGTKSVPADSWTRCFVKTQAPNYTAATLYLTPRMDVDTPNVEAWFDCFMLEEVESGKTEPSPWKPAPTTIISPDNIKSGSFAADTTITIGAEKNILLDGPNNRISINAPGNGSAVPPVAPVANKILIGKLLNNKYGIHIKNEKGDDCIKIDEDGASIQKLTVANLTGNTIAGLTIAAESITAGELGVLGDITFGGYLIGNNYCIGNATGTKGKIQSWQVYTYGWYDSILRPLGAQTGISIVDGVTPSIDIRGGRISNGAVTIEGEVLTVKDQANQVRVRLGKLT
jgi:hypothetical protein